MQNFLQSLFVGQSQQDVERIIATTQSALEDDDPTGSITMYTLESFAIDHFRVPKSRTLSGTLRKKPQSDIWCFSREPIKKPLLKRLGTQSEDLQQKSCQSFLDILTCICLHDKDTFAFSLTSLFLPILKYMGDYPSRKQRLSTELTDQVFEHALANVSNHYCN